MKVSIPLPDHEGVFIEFDDEKVPRKFQRKFIADIKSQEFKNILHYFENSYFIGEFQVLTAPINKDCYSVFDAAVGELIFVNSKLPKAERAKAVAVLIKGRRAKKAEEKND